MKKSVLIIAAIMAILSCAYAQVNLATWDFQDATKRSAITSYSLFNSNPYTADSGIAANNGIATIKASVSTSSVLEWGGTTNYLPSLTYWDSGNGTKYWYVQLTTTGYQTITLSSKQRSSDTGPRDFKVQYSTNGSSWTDAGHSITVANNLTTGVLSNVSLPSACNNQSTLYLRWIMTSNTRVSGTGSVVGTGTSRIDDIVISGTAIAGNTPPSIPSIVQTPSTGITSSTSVSVSADVTDSDGTVTLVQCKWGTSSGIYPNVINMTASGNTYTTNSNIPVQTNGTTVYYVIYAEDDDVASNTSSQQSYTVTDPIPTITVTPTSLTGMTYVFGSGPSTLQTYTLSGTNLSPASENITVTGSTNYEVSLDGITFSSFFDVLYELSSLGNTTIHVRLKAGLPVGSYNNETIANSGGGATTQNVTCSGSVTAPLPTTQVLLRPTQIDISETTSESAVLMNVQNYSSDAAKYRLYNGTNQHNCWNTVTSLYVSEQSYDSGPLIPGTPSTSSTWWIPFQRGNNNSILASYRDRIPPYSGTGSSNYQTVALPTATAIKTPVSIVKTDVLFSVWSTYTSKHVILAYDATTGGTLISATSSALSTGAFTLKVESGTTIRRIEVRSLDNTLVESVTGTWPIVRVAAPTFDPVAGTYLTTQNVSLASATSGASFRYSTTSDSGPWSDYSGSIAVSSTTTIWAYAFKSGMTDSEVVSATYVLPIDVANIAQLRSGTVGTTPYRLTSEAIITFQQVTRNQKYIQDATGAIVIDDVTGKITSTYSLYDGITGLVGTLYSYYGLLQFLPLADPGAATSASNVVVPELRTLASLTSADQAKLVIVMGVTIDATSGNFTASAQTLDVTQDVTTLGLRTFPNTDYSETAIPTLPVNIVCLVGQYNAGMQISPRYLADFSYDDYPDGVEVDAGEVLITIIGANGNITPDPFFQPIQNPGFVVTFSQELELSGGGPWTVRVFSLDDWVACYYGSLWYVQEVPQSGENASYVTFFFESTKTALVQIFSGNGGNPTLPVVLSSFTATLNAHNYVQLTWVTQTETGVQGYYIFRGRENDLGTAILVSNMIPATNTSQQQSYVFVDSELFEDGMYYYWLQNADFDGSSAFHGPVTVQYSSGGGNNGSPNIPISTQLKAAYPNPFNPSTRIPYDLAKNAEVKISIYNSRGQIVRVFPIGSKDAGSYYIEWNGKSDRDEDCATGVYYIRMQAGDKQYNSKAVLIK